MFFSSESAEFQSPVFDIPIDDWTSEVLVTGLAPTRYQILDLSGQLFQVQTHVGAEL